MDPDTPTAISRSEHTQTSTLDLHLLVCAYILSIYMHSLLL